MASHNIAKMTTATTGTGTTITLGSASAGFLTFADAGVTDAEVVEYVIRDGSNTEVGEGVYTSSGTTLSRDVVHSSTNGGAKISLSGTATVAITRPAYDNAFVILSGAGNGSLTNGSSGVNVPIDDFYDVYSGVASLGTAGDANKAVIDVAGVYEVDVAVSISSASAFNGKIALVYTSGSSTYTTYKSYVSGNSILADDLHFHVQAEYFGVGDTIEITMNNNLGSTVTAHLDFITIRRIGAF